MARSFLPLGPVFCALLIGCSAPEGLEETISPEALEADPPEIVPLGELLREPQTRLDAEDADLLLARARATEARAASTR